MAFASSLVATTVSRARRKARTHATSRISCEHLGYSPSEALVCATRYGAELMGMGDEAGQVREGFLADLLLVDGDPVADVSLLQDKERLVVILKGGEIYKLDRALVERRTVRAAE